MVRKEVRQWLALVLAVSLLAASIDAAAGKKTKKSQRKAEETAELKILVDPILRFGSRLLRIIGAERENTVLSPVSVHSVFSLVLLGAKNGSETEKELQLGLSYGPCEREANKLFGAYTKLMDKIKQTLNVKEKKRGHRKEVSSSKLDIFTMAIAKDVSEAPKQDYMEVINQYFKSSFTTVSEEKPKETEDVANGINKWAKEAGFSDKMIEEDNLKEDFSLMLLSSVRVEAFWFGNLAKDKKKELFLNHGEDLVEGTRLHKVNYGGNHVEFRNNLISDNSSESFKELAPFDFHAADVQLKGGVSFASFMPAEKGAGKLAELEKRLLSSDENGMLNLCKTFQVLDDDSSKVNFGLFSMPQFQINSSHSLIEQLKSMGVKRVFDDKEAELTKMHETQLHVDKVIHKAMVEVNNKGLRPSGFNRLSLHLSEHGQQVNLELDRPFMFVIRYNRVPMLLGHLVEI